MDGVAILRRPRRLHLRVLPLRLVAVLVELVAVDYVVPDAVVAAGEGCDGVEEGVAEPDGKLAATLQAYVDKKSQEGGAAAPAEEAKAMEAKFKEAGATVELK